MTSQLSSLSMPFPQLSPRYGLTPESPHVQPQALLTAQGAEPLAAWPVICQDELLLDFGRKLSGRVWIEADGPLEYAYGSDPDQLALLLTAGPGRSLRYDLHDVYPGIQPWGRIESSPGRPVRLEAGLSVLRLLHLKAVERPVRLLRCWLEFSSPHQPLEGDFRSSDEELDLVWRMGAYTTLLCTQDNMDSLDGAPAPGSGYVIWDGPRRDREVWAGDLRPASLAWLSAYGDPEPVRNSLYMLWQGRHCGCSDHGLIPGSASSHQTFYEWNFWFLVNAWEYYLWSGDKHFLASLTWRGGLEQNLGWIKRKLNGAGLVEATNSWMWTFRLSGEMAALAIVQVAGLEAMGRLFAAAGQQTLAEEAQALATQTRACIPGKFFDPQARAMRMMAPAEGRRARYPLDANAWAVLYGIGDAALREGCLAAIDRDGLRAEAGLLNLYPPFDEGDGEWFVNPATSWMHNQTVWPYPNAYAAWAQMDCGQIGRGLEILKRFHRPHIAAGHATLWEVMSADGSTPIAEHGNLGSLCHAWGATGTYLLHRYILGIEPVSPGYRTASFTPNLGPLEWASGRIPTPHGAIGVELERHGEGVRGRLRLPAGIELTGAPQGVEICRAKAADSI